MKNCAKCKQSLPDEYFYKDASRPSGLRTSCKACSKSARNTDRDRERYQANKEACIAYGKAYYRANKSKGKENAKRSFKRAVDELSDAYVKHTIIKFTSLRREQVPQVLVELKRLEIAIKRKAKDVTNEEC